MTHTYQLTGMTCSGCEAKVKSKLLSLPEVSEVKVSKDNNTAIISMTRHIALSEFQKAIGGTESQYQISASQHSGVAEQTKNWFTIYKPIVLIFAYISTVALIASFQNGTVHPMHFMQIFMAGFFLTFSFFKLLNLKGFAESYIMYDVLAKRIPIWAYAYAFVELVLGISYAVNFNPFITNLTTLVVMSISIIGVLQSVLNKRKIQCACLGAVFNLPMSTITIMEDALMIMMSAGMLMLM